MALQEDCASVLDQFIHDVANLPAEVNHYMEEIQAIDKDLSKLQVQINTKDSALQKHVKANGSLVPHPKEAEFSQVILRLHDQCQELQDRKIGLAEKTSIMLERHVKKFDVKIRELQNGDHLPKDLAIPSLFNRKQAYPDSGRNIFSQIPSIETNQPLQTLSGNTVHNLPARAPSQQQVQQARISHLSAARPTEHRSSAPATPAPTSQHLHPHSHAAQQRQRESSVGSAIDPKRRRLNPSLSTNNLPVQSSSLRQSSHGPGTPKATTPSRSGSVPRSTPAASGTGPSTKKGASTGANVKKVAPHQQVSKLKGKPSKRSSLTPNPPSSKKTGAGRATSKGASPAAALRGGGRGASTGADSDTGSVLSTASSSSLHKPKREPRDENDENVNNEAENAAGSGSEDGVGEGEEEEDKGLYCTCNQVSYGDMVGCDNDDCPYQWFHLKCVAITKSPREDELWFCEECCTKGLGPPEGEGKPLGKGMVMKKGDGK
ncbi:MAG: hypothetical protein Q9160_007868 [Pyrenula sp. 1 TL-2023]